MWAGVTGGWGGHWVLRATDASLTSACETGNTVYVNELHLHKMKINFKWFYIM